MNLINDQHGPNVVVVARNGDDIVVLFCPSGPYGTPNHIPADSEHVSETLGRALFECRSRGLEYVWAGRCKNANLVKSIVGSELKTSHTDPPCHACGAEGPRERNIVEATSACARAVMDAYRVLRTLEFSGDRAAKFVREAAQAEEEAISRGEP